MLFNLLPAYPLDGGRIFLDILIIKQVPLRKAANITVITCGVILTGWFGWVIYRWVEGFQPWFSFIVGGWIGYNSYQLYQASKTDDALRNHPLMSGYIRWGSGLNTQFATGGNELDASALYVPDEDGGVGTPSKTNSWFTGAPKGTPAPTLSAAGGWAVPLHSQAKSNEVFQKMQKGGKVGGQEAWAIYATCGLPTATLSSIWKLSDVDGDQFLDAEEFALMAYLIETAQAGTPVPTFLPVDLLPPSKR